MGITYPIFSPPDYDSSIAAALNTKRTAEARRAVVSRPPRDRRDQGHAPGRLSSLAYEPQRTPQGGYFIWVERSWLNKLEALRQPGEGLSETIIRLVAMEAGGRPRRRAAELFGAETRRAPRGAWGLFQLPCSPEKGPSIFLRKIVSCVEGKAKRCDKQT
jgi:hypothetical protein